MPLIRKWHVIKLSGFVTYIYMFLIINVNVSVSRASASECILDAETSFFVGNSTCEGGDWGGFLNKNCSGGAFCGYLYTLAVRANQTGKIFLDPDEQRRCPTYEAGISGCEMDELQAGGGGCSDFSTDDVKNKLGYKLEMLKGKCGLNLVDESDDSCASCLRSWEEIKEMGSGNSKSMSKDSDVCSFAILVTLTSTDFENGVWISRLYSCLGYQHISEAYSEVTAHTERTKIGLGLIILIGGIIGLLIVIVFSVLILSKRIKTPIRPVDKHAWKPALSTPPPFKPASSVLSIESMILNVSMEEVLAATNNLHESNFIGEGTAGKVYRGVLSNNQPVAIKQISDGECCDTFLREIKSLLHVRHPNLVPLVGYCENENECFLIYELCPNGNLSEWLFGKDKILSWTQRLEIALGTARGLQFLHTFPQGCIVHRDVKPTNILLGTNFEAKLSDFGLCKVLDLGESCASSEVRGTFGYVDPEYQSNHKVISPESDIYSFGVVLLQMISGRKVIDMNMKKPMPLSKIAKSYLKKRSLVEFADPRLHGEYSVEKAIQFVFQLALLCTGLKRKRPTIEQVIAQLEKALNISTKMEASNIPLATPDRSTLYSTLDIE